MVTLLRHLASILILPATMTVVIPSIIYAREEHRWPATASELSLAIAGALTISAGLTLVCLTIWHFATRGRGTLAPWDPPRHLVVESVYRYVRNPMISGVVLILFGEAMALRSEAVLQWAILFFLINATYIPLWEEVSLDQRFGEDYREYKRHVGRWVPRLRPWTPPARGA